MTLPQPPSRCLLLVIRLHLQLLSRLHHHLSQHPRQDHRRSPPPRCNPPRKNKLIHPLPSPPLRLLQHHARHSPHHPARHPPARRRLPRIPPLPRAVARAAARQKHGTLAAPPPSPPAPLLEWSQVGRGCVSARPRNRHAQRRPPPGHRRPAQVARRRAAARRRREGREEAGLHRGSVGFKRRISNRRATQAMVRVKRRSSSGAGIFRPSSLSCSATLPLTPWRGSCRTHPWQVGAQREARWYVPSTTSSTAARALWKSHAVART